MSWWASESILRPFYWSSAPLESASFIQTLSPIKVNSLAHFMTAWWWSLLDSFTVFQVNNRGWANAELSVNGEGDEGSAQQWFVKWWSFAKRSGAVFFLNAECWAWQFECWVLSWSSAVQHFSSTNPTLDDSMLHGASNFPFNQEAALSTPGNNVYKQKCQYIQHFLQTSASAESFSGVSKESAELLNFSSAPDIKKDKCWNI